MTQEINAGPFWCELRSVGTVLAVKSWRATRITSPAIVVSSFFDLLGPSLSQHKKIGTTPEAESVDHTTREFTNNTLSR
jgi:hypothetical protein